MRGDGNYPSLVDITLRVGPETLREVITGGRPGMPSNNDLTQPDLAALIAFLGSTNPATGRGRGAGPAPGAGGGPVVASGGAPGGRTVPSGRAGGMVGPDYPKGVKVPEVRMYTGYGMDGTIVKPPYSTLSAYDLNTGTIKWQIPAGGDDVRAVAAGGKDTGFISQRTGIITTSSGLLFHAGGDAHAPRLRLGNRASDLERGAALGLARHSGDVRSERPAVFRRERDVSDRSGQPCHEARHAADQRVRRVCVARRTVRETMLNYIEGSWRESAATERIPVINPATLEEIGRTPLSPASEVDQAAMAAARAFPAWRRTPVTERVQYLFKLKGLLENEFEDISRTITVECGKTLAEARGEMRRAIENVEVACGTPILIQGYNSEDIAVGIDEIMVRQPLGVCAIVAPFNFPGMIPFWFLPYAMACGNTVVMKPSERVPLTMQKVMKLIDAIGLPAGVVNLVNGGREVVNALLDHPVIRSISFVGSSAVARQVYARAAAAGKRAQCQGGAKNPVVVLPDADVSAASDVIADSAFGCAGQRCLATSLAITVGEATRPFNEAIQEKARDSRHRIRAGGRRADGAGDLAGKPAADRRLDREGDRRGRARRRRRPQPRYSEVSEGEFHPPDDPRRSAVFERHHQDGDLRTGALDAPREHD